MRCSVYMVGNGNCTERCAEIAGREHYVHYTAFSFDRAVINVDTL